VIHRDISPSNVLLSIAGEVKLTDFGIAKEMHDDQASLTTGFKGKLVYTAPEQLSGNRLDERCDLFSLGVTLYEALSGSRPFDGQSELETFENLTRGTHVPLTELVADSTDPIALPLARAIETLLVPDRQHRCPTAAEFLRALHPLMSGLPARQQLAAIVQRQYIPLPQVDPTPTEVLPKPEMLGV
jgi:serine/threonine protein kinase